MAFCEEVRASNGCARRENDIPLFAFKKARYENGHSDNTEILLALDR
jgi:hypothetical protein